MKTITCLSTCALLALSSTTSHADLTFTAPGMTAPYATSQLSLLHYKDIGHYWKYIITGYNYRLYAGVPDGGQVKGYALRYKTGDMPFPGVTTVSAKINSQLILTASLSTSLISGTSGLVSHTFSTPIIIEDSDINAGFNYNTNMIGGNDYITIYGSALVSPPVPIGTLIAPSYVRDGGKPTLQWFITKSLSNDVFQVSIPNETEIESSNSGSGQSNNGHGNNVDGIDSSNPGKSAAVWARRGYYDTDYNKDGSTQDDEGHGGGSAISQEPIVNPVATP